MVSSFLLTQVGASEKHKVCTVCGEEKVENEFYKKGDRRDSSCKDCKRARRRDRYRVSWGISEREKLHRVWDIILDFYNEKLRTANSELGLVIERVKAKEGVNEWQAS